MQVNCGAGKTFKANTVFFLLQLCDHEGVLSKEGRSSLVPRVGQSCERGSNGIQEQ